MLWTTLVKFCIFQPFWPLVGRWCIIGVRLVWYFIFYSLSFSWFIDYQKFTTILLPSCWWNAHDEKFLFSPLYGRPAWRRRFCLHLCVQGPHERAVHACTFVCRVHMKEKFMFSLLWAGPTWRRNFWLTCARHARSTAEQSCEHSSATCASDWTTLTFSAGTWSSTFSSPSETSRWQNILSRDVVLHRSSNAT